MPFKLINEAGEELELTVENLPKAIKDDITKSAQGLVYSNIDSKISEMFGDNKNAGEKTSDWIARIISEKDTQIEQLKTGSPEVSKLQEDIQKLQNLNDTLKGQISAKETEFAEKLQQESLKSKIASIKISVPAHLADPSDAQAYEADAKTLLMDKFKSRYYEKDGKIFDKTKNEPVTDDNLKDLSFEQVIQRDNPYLFKEVTVPPTDPSNPANGKPTGSAKSFKSFEDISGAAVKAGHAVGSPAYAKFVEEKAAEAGIEI